VEHLEHFALSRDPFANEPLSSYYFASVEHANAERRLLRGVSQRKGLLLFTGPAGTGKTMVTRRLLDSLEEEMFEVCMLVPVPGAADPGWVLSRFAQQLGVENPATERAALLAQIYERLAIVREEGRHTLLILDESHLLIETGALPDLRGLLNLEYEDRSLLSMLVVGLPGLDEEISAEPALAGRVDIRVRLAPLDERAAQHYLAHRIRSVEGNPAILEAEAVAALVKLSEGIPRRLNTLADNALFEAYLAGRSRAAAADVRRAARDLGIEVEDEDSPSGDAEDADEAESPFESVAVPAAHVHAARPAAAPVPSAAPVRPVAPAPRAPEPVAARAQAPRSAAAPTAASVAAGPVRPAAAAPRPAASPVAAPQAAAAAPSPEEIAVADFLDDEPLTIDEVIADDTDPPLIVPEPEATTDSALFGPRGGAAATVLLDAPPRSAAAATQLLGAPGSPEATRIFAPGDQADVTTLLDGPAPVPRPRAAAAAAAAPGRASARAAVPSEGPPKEDEFDQIFADLLED
jgi:type II secretory pathway predicted ATPase ExeA